MRTGLKVAGFGLGLAALFFGARGVGAVAGPAPAPSAVSGAAHDPGAGHSDVAAHGGGGQTHGSEVSGTMPGGLQVAQDGYRLVPVSPELSTGTPTRFAFRVFGPDGSAVTRYNPNHERDLHLIVVRRDLGGFQHVHPTMGADGTWSIPLAVPAPGQYRVFADFQPAGRDRSLTLGVDVPAPGRYQPIPLPAPQRTAVADGYTVTLEGDLVPGASSALTLSVSKDGKPVTDLQPYLGAYGHLVALRGGDLAYLHVHPDGQPGDGRTAPGPDVTFYAEVPSAGGYRLYLDFQHRGTVYTAEFTAVAGAASVPVPKTEATAAPTATGHGEPGHGHD